MEYNIYCDESCYLESDSSNFMSIGGVWCPKCKVKEISNKIREIKENNGYPGNKEVKWTKISNANIKLYKDLVDFFFACDDIYFRIIVIDKRDLQHELFNQTHDEFYYKMYFELLKVIFTYENSYNVYADIKDTHSYEKCQKLMTVCCNNQLDFCHDMIKKVQPIRSDESQIIQLADILIGAVTFANRFGNSNFKGRSNSKISVMLKVKELSKYTLTKSTYLSEKKMNIFIWEGNYLR